MTFLYPAFAWAFLSLGAILILYLLKRRYEDRPVPSTFLWQKTLRDMTANRPFQRLKRNLLLPLHLLMAASVVLCLMQPVLSGSTAGEVVMIFDLSASMQATEDGRTRLDHAVETAGEILAGMEPQDTLTILAADGDIRQLLSRSTDREAARRVLNSLEPSNTAADLAAAVSLAQAMQREMDGMQIIVFSDEYTPQGNIAVHNASSGLDNRAVLSFTVEEGQGYARVINYGRECTVTLACYAEDVLCDARELHIPAGESAGTALHVPECDWACVALQEKDAIGTDDRMYFIPRAQQRCTVALDHDSSVFLDYAISLRDDVRLIKADFSQQETLAADLYVYGDGPVFFSRSMAQDAISGGETLEPQGNLTLAAPDDLTMGLSLKDVALRSFTPLQGGKSLMTLDGHSVMNANEDTVALGFDLNDTNLPMKYDFPILVQNVLAYMLPETAADVGSGICGESIRLVLPVNAGGAAVTTPGGKRINAVSPFTETDEAGLYTLAVEGAAQRYFAMGMPVSESDVRNAAPSVDLQGRSTAPAGGAALAPWLMLLFLVLLLMEWGVSRRGI